MTDCLNVEPLPSGLRVETGAVRFGNDWPGLFIRGDDCIGLLADLERGNTAPLKELLRTLVVTDGAA